MLTQEADRPYHAHRPLGRATGPAAGCHYVVMFLGVHALGCVDAGAEVMLPSQGMQLVGRYDPGGTVQKAR